MDILQVCFVEACSLFLFYGALLGLYRVSVGLRACFLEGFSVPGSVARRDLCCG